MKKCISVSLYGENICKYYVPLLLFIANLSKIIDINTTDVIIHVDELKYDLFMSMLMQENLHKTENIKIRKYPTKYMSYGMLWRFIPIFEEQYDCIVVADTDSIFLSNIVNVFHQKLIDNINDKAFCMAINGLCIQNMKLLRTFVLGNLVFFPKNMTNLETIKKYFYKLLDECNAVIYGFDEMMLTTFLHDDIEKDNYVFFRQQTNNKFELDQYILNIHKNIIDFYVKRYQKLDDLKYGSIKKYTVNNIDYEYVPYIESASNSNNKFFADFLKGKFILEEFIKENYKCTVNLDT